MQVVSGNSGSTVWSVQLPAEWASSQLAVLTVEEQLTLAAVGAPARCPVTHFHTLLTGCRMAFTPFVSQTWQLEGKPQKPILLLQWGAAGGLAGVSQGRGGAEQGGACTV